MAHYTEPPPLPCPYMPTLTTTDLSTLVHLIRGWGGELGFQQVGIARVDLAKDAERLEQWLALGRHGEMHYMQRHGLKRAQPEQLLPKTLSVICVRMNYLPEAPAAAAEALQDTERGYVSRYALGRDYHKLMRARLAQLARRIQEHIGEGSYRAVVDSAPLLEKALARDAGLGWIGKHTNLLNRQASSWFFLGEVLTDLPLPPDSPTSEHCGTCRACLDACPTQAIVAPYELDARRCISYLTIELRTSIPVELRKAIGNRIYGCDDCQLVCPWNKYAQITLEPDFHPRHGLATSRLVDLFAWSEREFLQRTEGSAIRRIGYECWLRNIAVALGNAPTSEPIIEALAKRSEDPSPLVREHVAWALEQHSKRHRDVVDEPSFTDARGGEDDQLA
jgi:epoxyqueuosine reductase